MFCLLGLRRGCRVFARDPGLSARPSRVVRAVAATRTATIAAFQMVGAGEDNEIAFPIKVFIFDKLAHCNNFIASALYRGLRLIGESS
jgi:hypothetical protein